MTFCGSSNASNSGCVFFSFFMQFLFKYNFDQNLIINLLFVCFRNGSNSNNSQTTIANSSLSDSLTNKGQRDLLINLLNNAKVDCVICYERAKNVEPIWNCRNCYQIMHLKCIMVWFIKSHNSK